MPFETEKRIIILDECQFDWTERALRKLEKLWNDGVPIQKIAPMFGLTQLEIALAIMHLEMEERITSRPGGLLGGAAS